MTVTRPSNGQVINASFHSIGDAIDYFDSSNLNNQFGADVGAEVINASLDFRGLPATLSYSGSQ